jgi:hypothetical protein
MDGITADRAMGQCPTFNPAGTGPIGRCGSFLFASLLISLILILVSLVAFGRVLQTCQCELLEFVDLLLQRVNLDIA